MCIETLTALISNYWFRPNS